MVGCMHLSIAKGVSEAGNIFPAIIRGVRGQLPVSRWIAIVTLKSLVIIESVMDAAMKPSPL